MKYYRYVKFLLLISSGFFLHSIYEWVQDIVIKHNLFSNSIDFFGNVIVAAGSAAIAYIISNYQLKKSKIEMEYVSKKETISKLQLIKLEIDTNKKVIQNISESDNYTYAIETAKEKISCNIWENVYLNLDIKDSIFTSIYNLYYKLGLLKSITNSDFSDKEIYGLSVIDIEKVTEDINDEIKTIHEELSKVH